LTNLKGSGSENVKAAEKGKFVKLKMSNRGALTVDDFLVSLSNIQSENFARMQETLQIQSKQLESIENLLNMKIDAEKQQPEPMQVLENPFALKLGPSVVTSTPKAKDVPMVADADFDEEEEEVVENFKGSLNGGRNQHVNISDGFLSSRHSLL
jgi:hypothetical protein